MEFNCGLCNNLSFPNISRLKHHINSIHQGDNRIILDCAMCLQSYSSIKSLVQHIRRKHPEARYETEASAEDYEVLEESDDITMDTDEDALLRSAACKHAIGIKENHLLSEAAANEIVESTHGLVDMHLEHVQAELRKNGIDVSSFSHLFTSKDTFAGLDTQAGRERELAANYGYMEPTPVLLGREEVWKKVDGKKRLVTVDKLGYIFPFLKNLERLLSCADVASNISESYASTDGVYRDVCDGSFYKEHPIFSEFPDAISIVAYYDDIEPANALGPKAKFHKLAPFYWFITNIHSQYRSALQTIQMLAIATTSDLRKFGADKLLADFISSLQKLGSENGCTLKICGIEKQVKGALVAFTGDTLASNYIGGFKESPSFAFSPCRICLVKSPSLKLTLSTQDLQLRDLADHLSQVTAITDPLASDKTKTHLSKVHGIIRRSVLMDAPFFDVTKCMTLDLMHVIFEGILGSEIKRVLLHCVNNLDLDIDVLNNRLDSFSMTGCSNSNHPTHLTIENINNATQKLKQNAAQVWDLALFLPFLIADHVPDNDENWECFIALLKVVTFCCSFELTSEDIVLLESMIQVYLNLFSRVYGEVSITPKHHYLLHVPMQIRMFGPLRFLWCFRTEGKHFRLKQSLSRSGNFINPCFSVARRHETKMSIDVASNALLSKTVEVKGAVSTKTDDLPYYLQLSSIETEIEGEVTVLDEICAEGVTYRRNDVMLIDKGCEEEYPTMCIVNDIIVVKGRAYLVCINIKTIVYNGHLNAYLVESDPENMTDFKLHAIKNLRHKFPLLSTQYNGCKYVVLKQYAIFDFV